MAVLANVYSDVLGGILRYLAPIIVLILLLRCLMPLLTFRREPEIWGWLCLPDGKKIPVTHWETVIGSGKHSDIVFDNPNLAKTHGVLTRYDDGSWSIAAASGAVLVNGKKTSISPLYDEDVITMGDMEMMLQPITKKQEQKLAQIRTKASSFFSGFGNLFLLTVFQALCASGPQQSDPRPE